MVSIKERYQRQGIATALYDFVEADLGYTLKPSQWLTEAGQAFREARSPNGMPIGCTDTRLSKSMTGSFSTV
jgi:hypothetical protein